MSKEKIITAINARKTEFFQMAEEIWNNPELSYREEKASFLQKKYLAEAGFRITELDSIQKYAFVAECGEGYPVIGLVGEFDALPGLSQKVSTVQEAAVPGGPGHGCGHNLLGTACLAAAMGLKSVVDSGLLSGRVRYFGCPAEEQLGKPVLAAAGVFSGLDAALCWHPADINTVAAYGTNASIELSFRFKGIPAHAAQVPHLGRSALDALTLMSVGIEFLREHMPASARVHYVVTEGGDKANIVPKNAAGAFQVRSPRMRDIISLLVRVVDVAKGAALMTGTEVSYEMIHGCYDVVPNRTMSGLLHKNLKEVPLPSYTPEELDFARRLSDTLSEEQKRTTLLMLGVDSDSAEKILKKPIHDEVGYWGDGWIIPASTDVGDVSHIVPTAQINTATYPMGIGSHTWQATAASGSSLGMKGMLYAAKVLGTTAWDLMTKPKSLHMAKEEFDTTLGKEPYNSAKHLVEKTD
jgi:aminobenzoyl-glutamate utilization protein B